MGKEMGKTLMVIGSGLLVILLTNLFPFSIFHITPILSAWAERPEITFRKQPQIQQIKPFKPVRIKLHRNNRGEYSWDITGDNVDEIIKVDRKLRKLLRIE